MKACETTLEREKLDLRLKNKVVTIYYKCSSLPVKGTLVKQAHFQKKHYIFQPTHLLNSENLNNRLVDDSDPACILQYVFEAMSNMLI